MNKFFADDFAIDSDTMLDLFALEEETQAVSDLHNGFLCTVEHD